MNIIENEACRNLLAEKEKLGLGNYRRQCLQGLKLKTVIKVYFHSRSEKEHVKQQDEHPSDGQCSLQMHDIEHNLRGSVKVIKQESHGAPVSAMQFNNVDPECSNLFATVGADQATVYDDLHMGDSIGVVVHYTNEETKHTPGGELTVCAWLNARGHTAHPAGDALLAVSGEDKTVSVISVVESKVLYQLKGHRKEVIQLAACPLASPCLVSLSKDGHIKLWDVLSETCIASAVASDATCLAIHPEGAYIIAGGRKGALTQYAIPNAQQLNGLRKQSVPEEQPITLSSKAVGFAGFSTELISCLQFLNVQHLLVKSAMGNCSLLDCNEGNIRTTWKVPGYLPSSTCKIGATLDGEYICVGSSRGTVYIYEAATGSLVKQFTPPKVTGPIHACILLNDCRHLLVAAGNGFVFRFEYLASYNLKDSIAESEE